MLAIIGCGNLNRSDDGVGVVVARRLAARFEQHPVKNVRVFDCGTAGMEVMFAARGCDALLVIDASRSGSEAGAIFDVPGEELERDRDPGLSLHDFRWDHALYAGRRIFKEAFPKEVRVWLVEAGSIALGTELTAEVARAAETVYRRALTLAAEHALRAPAGEAPLRLAIRRGSLQMPKDVYDRYFAGLDGAVLFEKGGRICAMPVSSSIGGTLVKQKNLAGDRAIDVSEIARAQGWETDDIVCEACWDGTLGALSLHRSEERSP